MQAGNTVPTLDRNQLRDVTLDDQELMRELLSALIDDTSRQILVLDAAIREADSPQCVRLAHYSKGACANMGAKAAAAVLQKIEKTAAAGDFAECSASLHILSGEIERLREEARSL